MWQGGKFYEKMFNWELKCFDMKIIVKVQAPLIMNSFVYMLFVNQFSWILSTDTKKD